MLRDAIAALKRVNDTHQLVIASHELAALLRKTRPDDRDALAEAAALDAMREDGGH
jgi:hypothetical protein